MHSRTMPARLLGMAPSPRRTKPALQAQFSTHGSAYKLLHPSDVLLLDATNILAQASAAHKRWRQIQGSSLKQAFADWLAFLQLYTQPKLTVAVFDAPRWQRPQQHRERLALGYMQRRKRRQQQDVHSSSPAGAEQQKGDRLWPFKQVVARCGGLPVVAAQGWEADDCLAAACSAVHAAWPDASVLVASGDGDVAQLLNDRTAWLQLHTRASLAAPLGVTYVTAADYEQQHGFPPAALPDYLALTGKKETSIGGLGVGASTAARLLRQYRCIDAAQAAAGRGELKGWSPAAQRLLTGADPAAAQTLQRNRQLFALNCDAEVLDAKDRQQLERAVQEAMSSNSSSSSSSSSRSSSAQTLAEVAWAYPMQAGRWRFVGQHVERLSQQLSAHGIQHTSRAVVGGGLAVDLLLLDAHTSSSSSGSDSGGQTAVFVMGDGDLPPSAADKARAACAAADGLAALDPEAVRLRNKALLPLVNGALKHHLQLVLKAGCSTVCVPWWHVPS